MSRGRGKQRKSRMRWTLLGLLWAWALCMFMVADLFFDVEEFDAIRPRATSYRAMRYVAHRMVGEPYLEDDGFGRVHRELDRAARTPASHGDGPETRAFLQSIGSRRPQMIQAILRRLSDRPDPALADALLEARSRIPHDLLGDYGLAAASTVAKLCAMEEDPAPGRSPREILTGVRGDLALAALEAQSRRLAGDPLGLRSSDWRAVRTTVERIGWVAPGYERVSPFVDALGPTRTSLRRLLAAAAADNGSGSEAQVEALRLASLVGDEDTAEICLRFLKRRTSGKPALTREAFLVEERALQTVRHQGNAQHRAELERWLSRALAQARRSDAQRYMKHLRSLAHGAGSAPGIRDQVMGAGANGGNHHGSSR